jgi:hypothetical protein
VSAPTVAELWAYAEDLVEQVRQLRAVVDAQGAELAGVRARYGMPPSRDAVVVDLDAFRQTRGAAS